MLTKFFLATAMLVGTAAAFAYNGSAQLGFDGTSMCGCPSTNGPLLVAIPKDLAENHQCCQESITLSYNDRSIVSIFSGIFDDGKGTEDVALSAMTFGLLEDEPGKMRLTPVTWSFNNDVLPAPGRGGRLFHAQY